MIRVLDASALIAYLEKKAGCEKEKDSFLRPAETEKRLLMSVVNWGEVYYILIKEYGPDKAREVISLIETFPLDIIPDDTETAKQAAHYKALKKLPYADSFAAALSRIHKAELMTADKEFKRVEDEVKIIWI